jgi:nitrite reductase (NADH) large subunit
LGFFFESFWRRKRGMKSRLVVIGNGMAGARVVEEILSRAPDKFDIVMFGAEPYGNYNRILLSNVLNQTQEPKEIFMNPLTWYKENNITLHAGVKAFHIDRQRKVILAKSMVQDGTPYLENEADLTGVPLEVPYDYVIVATGSRPFVPPIEGFGQKGTFLFRTIDDCRWIAQYARNCRKALVIGGGLLGLEAARGLMTHNLEVTVVEAAPQLMGVQLDLEAGQMLKGIMESMGIRVLVSKLSSRIEITDGKVTGLAFKDGERLDTDMVVISTGIRPITEVARSSGLTVNRGIVCDDQMRTSDPNIFAVGECVEHRGVCYGLVDPIWDQARVLADVITGCGVDAAYEGSRLGTKLKVMGVELASMGSVNPSQPQDEVIVYRDPNKGVYQKMIVRENKILGAILLGNIETADALMRLYKNEGELPENRAEILFGTVSSTALVDVADLPDSAQICNCNGVCKKTIVDAIIKENRTSVAAVGELTKAGKGCGSCRGLIAQIIESTIGNVSYDPREHYYVPGVPLEKSQLVAEIRARGLKSVSAVFQALADGKEDPDSKVGLASLLKTLWPKEYEDERDARFINDRVHANIQKDGTFSVVPRIYGGVTSPEELMRIAQVAIKYKVPMVKLTGGQRIDLLGIKKEDLPKIWKDLDMPSGHAYTKAFRTCKSCVGTDFCRYGLGDSIALAQQIEHRFQGLESPHKVKMATTGCPRNCSEAYVKDVGAVAIGEGKWEIYVGGAAGSIVRKGDLLCVVTSHEEALKMIGRFLEYYRQHAKYLERTYGFVERIGVDVLKGILVEDSLGICRQLDERIQKAVDAYKDPWKEAQVPAYPHQFEGTQLVEILKVAENNG